MGQREVLHFNSVQKKNDSCQIELLEIGSDLFKKKRLKFSLIVSDTQQYFENF